MNDVQKVRAVRNYIERTGIVRWRTLEQQLGLNQGQVIACLCYRCDPLYIAAHFPAITGGMNYRDVCQVLNVPCTPSVMGSVK